LTRGPLHAGHRTDLWTLPRVPALIQQEFGVRYHPAHVWKVLTALQWSCQKPERRAVERDEPAIARWTQTEWPRIKKVHGPEGPPCTMKMGYHPSAARARKRRRVLVPRVRLKN
jgi:hypothetical protein